MKRQFKQTALKSAFVSFCVGILSMGIYGGPSFANSSASASVTPSPASSPQQSQQNQTQATLMGDPNKVPAQLEGVGVKEHLGEVIDLEGLEFISSEDGQPYPLKKFFESGKPIVMNLVYYECPMLCTMVLNGLMDGMKGLDWSVGDQYNVITISVDPSETAEDAELKRKAYVQSYVEGKTGTKSKESDVMKGWHFFTAKEDQVKKLAGQLGFEYKYDEVQKEYAHPAVTFVLTPEGKISRYLYGIQYRPRDLRLALLEASQGKVGNVFDRLLMFCYHYEPSSRGYALHAVRVMQAGALATLAALGGYLAMFWTRQRKGKQK